MPRSVPVQDMATAIAGYVERLRVVQGRPMNVVNRKGTVARVGADLRHEGLAERLVAEMMAAAAVATEETAKEIVTASKGLLPIGDPLDDPDRTEALRNSYHVRHSADGPLSATFEIAVEAPYAVKQHESRHLQHPRGGGNKFLEHPTIAAIPEWERKLAVAVQRAFGAV